MYFDELKEVLFSIIKESDPYRESKQVQVKNWCYAFLVLFTGDDKKHLAFFLDVLSDEECWQKSNTMLRMELNRHVAAKKMVQLKSWKGKTNPLDDFDRYRVATWCCLEEDIVKLFSHFKQKYEVKNGDLVTLKKLIKSLSSGRSSDKMMEYWSHTMGGCASELQLEGKHLYEYGLNIALDMHTKYVEAVKFFWNKIRLVSEDEISGQKKSEIFMKTAVRVAGVQYCKYPEIFEFFISQVRPDTCSKFLRREYDEHRSFGSLPMLADMLRFDLFKKLFDSFEPDDVSEDMYYTWFTYLKIDEYSDYFASESLKLFLHIWMREGFDRHRAFVFKKEMNDSSETLLMPFVMKNYMEPVWAVMDKASPDQIQAFMNTKRARYIIFVLNERRDLHSLKKLSSYVSLIKDLEQSNTSHIEEI